MSAPTRTFCLRFLLMVSTAGILFSGCLASYSSIRPAEKEAILAGPQGADIMSRTPYEGADAKEELVALNIEIPGFPIWRRYYWTDKALWGNRGFVRGGPGKTEISIDPKASEVFGRYEPILENLKAMLTVVESPTEDQVVIVDQPIYDRAPSLEEKQWAAEKGLSVEHRVRKGESLWLIAGYPEVYANPLEWPKIYQANRDRILDPNLIYPGQEFRIPRDAEGFRS